MATESLNAPYINIKTAEHEPLREVCGVGPFSGLLPPVAGHAFSETDEELISASGVPDSRCWRHLGRAGCLVMSHYKPLKEILDAKRAEPRRIGIYSSISIGSLDWNSISELATKGFENFETIMRKKLPPKQIFKYGPNIPAAQLGIFLGATGPLYSFQDRPGENSGPLEQGVSDLLSHSIDYAIVVAAFSLEDPLQNFYNAKNISPETTPAEASAGLLLSRESLQALNLRGPSRPRRNSYLGTADSLIRRLEATHA
ncbi:MAG: hypothetical protein ACXVB9_21665 [Bdellovibrionota bacterium]